MNGGCGSGGPGNTSGYGMVTKAVIVHQKGLMVVMVLVLSAVVAVEPVLSKCTRSLSKSRS